ncbi:MAG TPA: MFS transporter [Vicinamibacterales bacterium]|nr:MFS transporter [Vicinamibacterales bacterium]
MSGFLKKVYREFPRQFWTVVLVSFIDKVGGTLVFPFFALYVTRKFNVGMTQAGIVLGIISFSSFVGGIIGGALTDRLGRRKPILFGLVFSALSSLTLGFANNFEMLYPLAVLIGLLSDVGGPAHGAMIADILPERQRQDGFGILRVAGNIAWIIGPTIGGFVASRSFLAVFIMDAVVSCIVALLFYLLMPETRPQAGTEHHEASLLATFRNYHVALRDAPYLGFLSAGMLAGLVYIQMYNSLSVFLRNVHGVPPQRYGLLLSVSAVTVILFQFRMLRVMKGQPRFLLMAAGALFYMIGFGMFGFVSAYWLFAAAVVIITVGEMIFFPIGQALASSFAPAQMRGRYMAVYELTGKFPATFGPAAAGVIIDNFNPAWLWHIGALLCAVSAMGFYMLQIAIGGDARFSGSPTA